MEREPESDLRRGIPGSPQDQRHVTRNDAINEGTRAFARFVSSYGDVPLVRGPLTVVLDPTWVPDRDTHGDAVWLLPALGSVIEQRDLFSESLDLVNSFARDQDLVDRLAVEGVSYWLRLREEMWHWVHEQLLWRYTLGELGILGPGWSISIPSSEAALISVARSIGADVEVIEPPPAPVPRPTLRSRVVAPIPSGVRNLYRIMRPHPETVRIERHREAVRKRTVMLERRLERIRGRAGDPVLVVSPSYSHQVVDGTRTDPNLSSVVAAVEGTGQDTVIVGWGMAEDATEHWPSIDADERLLPQFWLESNWGDPADIDRAASDAQAAVDRLASPGTTLAMAGMDVTASFGEALQSAVARVVADDMRTFAWVGRLLDDLRPAAILMSHEGHRLPWLLAASRRGIPTFAVQHGVLYERHPGYPDGRDGRQLLPTRTYVNGDDERRVLLAIGYLDSEVRVFGSPRLDLDHPPTDSTASETDREAVRAELGVRGDDALVVFSTASIPYMRRSYVAHMLTSLLASSPGRAHLVFKQHPGERDEGPYHDLVVSLARACGYEAPPVTTVKDVDLYRLLRAADAHVGQLSTVLTDAVVAGTVNLVATVQASPPAIDYVGLGVGTAIRSSADLADALRTPPPPNPDARAKFLAEHFRPGPAGQLIAADISAVAAIRSRSTLAPSSAPAGNSALRRVG